MFKIDCGQFKQTFFKKKENLSRNYRNETDYPNIFPGILKFSIPPKPLNEQIPPHESWPKAQRKQTAPLTLITPFAIIRLLILMFKNIIILHQFYDIVPLPCFSSQAAFDCMPNYNSGSPSTSCEILMLKNIIILHQFYDSMPHGMLLFTSNLWFFAKLQQSTSFNFMWNPEMLPESKQPHNWNLKHSHYEDPQQPQHTDYSHLEHNIIRMWSS